MVYCSLGEFCHAATLLKDNGLKHASFPFDWIFSNDQMVKHCVEDDFKTFLDKSEYTTAAIDSTICEHAFYSTMVENYQEDPARKKVIFNHHNPLVKEEDYAYFERCVNRFRELLASPEEKTFVMFQRGDSDITKGILKSFSLIEFLKKYTSNFTLLVIHYNVTGNSWHQLITSDNLKFLNIETLSESRGLGFYNHEDDIYLNNIFNEIR